jgi:hypothetical protein
MWDDAGRGFRCEKDHCPGDICGSISAGGLAPIDDFRPVGRHKNIARVIVAVKRRHTVGEPHHVIFGQCALRQR